MISPMRCVEIIGPRDCFGDVLDAVQESGVVHVTEIPLSEGEGPQLLHRIHLSDEQAQKKEDYEELVELLGAALQRFPSGLRQRLAQSEEFESHYARLESEPPHQIRQQARSLYAKARSFERRRRNLEDDLSVLSDYEEIMEAFAPLVESTELPRDYRHVGLILQKDNRHLREPFEQEIRKLTAGQCSFQETILDDGRVGLLVGFHEEFARRVQGLLAESEIMEIRGPRYLRDKPFEELLVALQRDVNRLREDRQALEDQVARFRREQGPLLLALQNLCRDRLARLETIPKFACTRYTFIMQGWVPGESLDDLRGNLQDRFGPEVRVRRIRKKGSDSPPVKLHNPPAVRPFQRLLALLPLPKYGTVDPSPLVAAFFPPIFGLMLGDVGYGLLVGLGAFLVWHFAAKRQLAREIAIIFGWCALYTVGFGFLFGEMFGSFGEHIGLEPLWRERFSLHGADKADAMLGYLFLALAVGLGHVLIGLVLGILNALKTGSSGRALQFGARIMGLFGLFFLVGWLSRFLPSAFMSAGVVSLLIFFILMLYVSVSHPTHGLLLPLEILSTVGHVLSYARIMAIGMASVVLALLANMFGDLIGNIVLAAVVVVLLHALNLALGVIDPTIQGLRLHYVEFFSKFYLSGGRAYRPFCKTGGAIE